MANEVRKSNNDRHVNMSEIEGSASNSIVNWWSNYDFETSTSKQIYNDLIEIIPENKRTEPKVINLFKNLQRARDNSQAAIAIGNFILSGDNQGIVAGTKEKDRKFMKNFGRK